MNRSETDQKLKALTDNYSEWSDSRKTKMPEFREYRQDLPQACLIEHFLNFVAAFTSGLEIKNIYSIYSKLMCFAPEFVDQYISSGPLIERPVSGSWNLKELVMDKYQITESIWRVIEQEKIPDSHGTARSGLEALQAVFVKDLVLGQKEDSGDYKIGQMTFENKGESGRMIGQERIFNADEFKRVCNNLTKKYKAQSWPLALRSSLYAGNITHELTDLLKSIYNGVSDVTVHDLIDIYMDLLSDIPEHQIIVRYKKQCDIKETMWLYGNYSIREVPESKEVSAELREKECFLFIAGLMELQVYHQNHNFDVLDVCETQTGRIFSFDMRSKNLKDLAQEMKGKVRFYGSIGNGTRDNAHQIGIVY